MRLYCLYGNELPSSVMGKVAERSAKSDFILNQCKIHPPLSLQRSAGLPCHHNQQPACRGRECFNPPDHHTSMLVGFTLTSTWQSIYCKEPHTNICFRTAKPAGRIFQPNKRHAQLWRYALSKGPICCIHEGDLSKPDGTKSLIRGLGEQTCHVAENR